MNADIVQVNSETAIQLRTIVNGSFFRLRWFTIVDSDMSIINTVIVNHDQLT